MTGPGGHGARASWPSAFLLLGLAFAACGEPAPSRADAVVATPPGDVTSGAAKAKPARRALAELRAAAMKRLAADRAVASNRLGYEQALARQERIRLETGMAAQIPKDPIDAETLDGRLRAVAEEQGLIVVDLEIGPERPSEPVPSERREAGPYPYRFEQLFASRPISLTLGGASARGLRSFYAAVVRSRIPLPVFEVREDSSRGVTLRGVIYREAEVTPPHHALARVDRAALAEECGVSVPEGAPELAEIDALIAKHEALEPALRAALRVLDRSHLAAARFDAYVALTERLQVRPLPKAAEETP